VRDGNNVKLAASAEFVESAAGLPAFEAVYGFRLGARQLLVLSGGENKPARIIRALSGPKTRLQALLPFHRKGTPGRKRRFPDLMFFGVAAARTCDLIVRSMPVCPLPRERKVTKKAARTLSIENVPLGILKLDRRNPRQHSRQQIAQIARSIEAFGFNVPILVDENLTVLAGRTGAGWSANRLARGPDYPPCASLRGSGPRVQHCRQPFDGQLDLGR
jgi:hypothetical protein